MSLLDLPPELFENVVHQLVSVAGINRAWRVRGVCRTFRSVITHDILAKQNLETLTDTAMPIFVHNSGLCLYYRSKVPLDAHRYLPDTISDMVSYLAEELNCKTYNEKEILRKDLCESQDRSCPSYQTLSILRSGDRYGSRYSTASSPPFGSLEKLIAAIYARQHNLVPELMQALPSLASHPILGAPLQLATELGHEAAVKAILSSLSAALDDERERNSIEAAIIGGTSEASSWLSAKGGFAISDAIHTAIVNNDEILVNILANWHKDQRLKFPKPVYNDFLQAAIDRSSLSVVRAVLLIPFATRGSPKEVR